MDKVKVLIKKHLTFLRRVTQGGMIAALLAILLSRQVGVNLETQSIQLFGMVIWPHEVALILLILALPFAVLAGFAVVFGRAFCGWACPQTALCEMANAAQRVVTDSRSRGVPRRVAIFAGVAVLVMFVVLGGGVAIVSVLVSPNAILGMATGHFSTSLLKGITVASVLILADVFVLRHMYCEWICLVGWWQRLFDTKAALRVAFATDRARECVHCSDCRTSCFMGIEPRRRDLPKTCLNCGRCVVACTAKMAPLHAETLISYRFGQPVHANVAALKSGRATRFVKTTAASVLLIAVASLLYSSIGSRDTVQMRVRQTQGFAVELVRGEANGEYAVEVYNNSPSALMVDLGQTGLPQDAVTIAPNPVSVPAHGSGRARLSFRVAAERLHPGRNDFWATAAAVGGSGRQSSYHVIFGLPVVSVVTGQDADRRDKDPLSLIGESR